jgi:outer membrane murein-binding lipoprotein Lpp
MSRAAIALPILLGVIVVLWGCSPYQSATTPAPDKSLEARVDKLEKELKTAKELTTSEQNKRIAAEKERDALRVQIKARGDELAKAQTDLDGLRRGLKDLLGKADAALAPFDANGTAVSAK